MIAGRRATRSAFTLIELMVAVMIAAGIAGATVMALSQSLKARDASRERQQAMMRADTVAGRIAQDIAGFVREGDLFYAQVAISDQRVERRDRDELLLFTTMNRRIRAGTLQNEGGEYEIQYRLTDNEQLDESGEAQGGVLWRRADPVPDEVPDGGGLVVPVSTGIRSLSFDVHDGESWQTSWESDRQGYPYALRVLVEAESDNGKRSAWASRVVALDRVPRPFSAPVEVDPNEGSGR